MIGGMSHRAEVFLIQAEMVRPVVVMAEMEPPEDLSARKLVLETGKFNVITAYSIPEALETLATFPKVHGVVLHAAICGDGECDKVLGEVKKRLTKALRVALTPSDSRRYKAQIIRSPVMNRRCC